MSTKAVLRIRRNPDAVLAEMGKRFTAAWKSGRSSAHVFIFESPAALFRLLTPKRWELVERLQTLGATSVRGLARALGRDVKRVHEDVAALIEVGLIERTEHRRTVVPFNVIEADFALRAARQKWALALSAVVASGFVSRPHTPNGARSRCRPAGVSRVPRPAATVRRAARCPRPVRRSRSART